MAQARQSLGYKKIIDFKNLSSDQGLYNRNGTLVFYNLANGSSVAIQAGIEFDLLLTRNGSTGQVTGYINEIEQFQFTDSGSAVVFTTPSSGIIQFLQDDTVTGQRDASGGTIDYVRIYNSSILPSDEVNSAPAPSTLAMLGMASATFAGYFGWRWRKQLVAAA